MNTLDYIIKKFNLKKTGPGTYIPGSRSKELLDLFRELDFKSGAEIGVETGLYSEQICKTNPNLMLYCIDPWQAYPGYRDHVSQKKQDQFYLETQIRLAPYKHKIIRNYAEEAYRDFADNSLDFVYIDGNHDFFHVTQDIHYWIPKVRPGGIVAGHDYRRINGNNHVKDVIPAYAYAKHIAIWFILYTHKESSTWFWVKT